MKDATWDSSWAVLQGAAGGCDSRARGTAVLNLARSAAGSPPSDTRTVVAEVIEAAKDRSMPVRRAAMRLLEWFGHNRPEEAFGYHLDHVCSIAADALADEVIAVRCWAARALAGLGNHAEKHLDKVHAAVRDSDAAVRCLACAALARMGQSASGLASSYSSSVAWSLKDQDAEVRRAAAFALAQMDEVAINYGAIIARTLKRKPLHEGGDLVEPDAEVRRLCVRSLERMGDQAASFTPELICALESDPDTNVRRWAIRSLEHAARTRHVLRLDEKDPEAASHIKAIARRIVDSDPVVRQWVLLTLARLGKDAHCVSEVMRAITQSLGDQESLAVRCIAVGAAAQLRETSNLAEHHSYCITEALHSSDKEIRRTGALALALIGPTAPKAADHVLSALAEEDVVVRRGAARALEQFTEMKDSDMKKAASYIDDSDVAVRLSALNLLGRLENQAEPYAQRVNEILEASEQHPQVHMMASWALPRLGGQGEILMYRYRKAQEAKKVAAEEKSNPVGRCYQGVSEMLWSMSHSMEQKAGRYMPESFRKASQKSRQFAGATMRRFKGEGTG